MEVHNLSAIQGGQERKSL